MRNYDCKKIYLCSPDLEPITVLNGVKTETVEYDEHVKDFDTLTFEVDEYINVDGKRVKSNGYDDLEVYMNLYLEDIGCFQMQHPSTENDGSHETKTVTAYSLEREFMDKDFVGFKINTGETDSFEYLAADNLREDGMAKEYVVFYRPDKKDLSLMHLVMEKMPGWSVEDDDIDNDLWNVKLSFSEDNINLYALLTSTIAPKAECIFMFDTLHRKIKAIGKKKLDSYRYETNVFVGYRNLAQSVSINVDEDSVYTRFNCEGADSLKLNDWNYNDSRIFDISYFTREPYMSSSLQEKVKKWVKWREDNRETFAELSKRRAAKNEEIYELKYRVPNDADAYKQWDNMKKDALTKNLNYYYSLLGPMQLAVDPDPQYTTDADGKQKYVPWKKSDGSVDHERYLAEQKKLLDANKVSSYYSYYEIITYVIPNIEIAIVNYDITNTNDKKSYVKGYEEDWKLYGTEEIEGRRKDYLNRLETLKQYEKPWNELTDEEKKGYAGNEKEGWYKTQHEEYVKIKTAIGDENTPGTLLYEQKQLNAQLKVKNDELNAIDAERNPYVTNATLDNPDFGFTEKEKVVINTLFHDTDYQNENIVSVSTNTVQDKIDVEKELYDDCVKKLSEVSQPQITFTTNMDNLLRLPEFAAWNDDFVLLKYIRLGIKDDYSVKLRLIGITWNPCEVTPDITVEFCNMITSRSGRSDLTQLLDSDGQSASKNSISIGANNSNSVQEYVSGLLDAIVNNGLFKGGGSGTGTGGSSILNKENMDLLNNLFNGYFNFHKLDVDNLNVDKGSFNEIFAKYIDTDLIKTHTAIVDVLRSQQIITQEISASTGKFTDYLTGVHIKGDVIEGNTIVADKLVLRGSKDSLMYQMNNLGDLDVTKLTNDQLRQNLIDGTIIVAKSITSKQIDVDDIVVNASLRVNQGLQVGVDGKTLITDLTALTGKVAGWNLTEETEDTGAVDEYGVPVKRHLKGSLWYGTGENAGKLYLGEKPMDGNVYIGTDGISMNNRFQFNMSTGKLVIRGDVYADNGTFNGKITSNEGKIGPWNINSSSIWKGSETIGTSGASNIYLGDNGFSLGDKLIFKDGNLSINGGGTFSGKLSAASGSFTGDVTANTLTANTSGSIAGWNITSGGIRYECATHQINFLTGTNSNKDFIVIYNGVDKNWPFWVHSDGELYASNATIKGKIYANEGEFSGKVTATSGSFTGEIYANKGTFTNGAFSSCEIKDGCWFGDSTTADTNRIKIIQSGDEVYLMKGTGTKRVGIGGATTNATHSEKTGVAIWAGADHSSNDTTPFKVYYNGDVEAQNITVKTLKAESGGIGGFLLTDGNLYGDASTITAKMVYVGMKEVSLEGHTHNAVTSVDSTHYAILDSSGGWAFAPYSDESLALGKSGHKWGNIYSKNATINTSDENEKEILSGISTNLEKLFMNLAPVQYKWKNFKETDHHDRIHLGFGAQSTAHAAESIGLNPFDYSMICKDNLQSPTVDGRNEEWGLRYSELHALEVHMIQKQQKEIEKLKAEIAQLKKAVSVH